MHSGSGFESSAFLHADVPQRKRDASQKRKSGSSNLPIGTNRGVVEWQTRRS